VLTSLVSLLTYDTRNLTEYIRLSWQLELSSRVCSSLGVSRPELLAAVRVDSPQYPFWLRLRLQMFVRTLSGKTVVMPHPCDGDIATLRRDIAEVEGIPPSMQVRAHVCMSLCRGTRVHQCSQAWQFDILFRSEARFRAVLRVQCEHCQASSVHAHEWH
jgi:hypothetical protein